MSSRAQTLAHIEESEYIRQLCREEAHAIIAALDIERALEEPVEASVEIIDDLVTALMPKLIPLVSRLAAARVQALGLEGVPDFEIAEIVSNALDDFQDTADDRVAAALQETARRLHSDDDRYAE